MIMINDNINDIVNDMHDDDVLGMSINIDMIHDVFAKKNTFKTPGHPPVAFSGCRAVPFFIARARLSTTD